MASAIKKELKNVMTFYYLMKLDHKVPETPEERRRAKARQDKKVYQVMKN